MKVSTLDLREPPQHPSTLFDLTGAGAYVTIYDVKRRARYVFSTVPLTLPAYSLLTRDEFCIKHHRNPFQFVVGTGVSVELVDSRMAKQPLISWAQPESYSPNPRPNVQLEQSMKWIYQQAPMANEVISCLARSDQRLLHCSRSSETGSESVARSCH